LKYKVDVSSDEEDEHIDEEKEKEEETLDTSRVPRMFFKL
jgi:hypothetical protein